MPDKRNKYWIYPWKGGKIQALALADQLPGRMIKREGSRYRYLHGDVIINWGNSVLPPFLHGLPILNNPNKVGMGKIKTYEILKANNVKTLEFTVSQDQAEKWQRNEFKVVGRNSNHGMGGQGITVYQPGDNLRPHMFYTKYSKKERELRVHVFLGQVIFIQEKLKKNDVPNADKYIRSHNRGWCFAFKHLADNPAPDTASEIAIKACAAMGLDFGAVDIGYNRAAGCRVFEVNTAPGIEETTLEAYTHAIRQL